MSFFTRGDSKAESRPNPSSSTPYSTTTPASLSRPPSRPTHTPPQVVTIRAGQGPADPKIPEQQKPVQYASASASTPYGDLPQNASANPSRGAESNGLYRTRTAEDTHNQTASRPTITQQASSYTRQPVATNPSADTVRPSTAQVQSRPEDSYGQSHTRTQPTNQYPSSSSRHAAQTAVQESIRPPSRVQGRTDNHNQTTSVPQAHHRADDPSTQTQARSQPPQQYTSSTGRYMAQSSAQDTARVVSRSQNQNDTYPPVSSRPSASHRQSSYGRPSAPVDHPQPNATGTSQVATAHRHANASQPQAGPAQPSAPSSIPASNNGYTTTPGVAAPPPESSRAAEYSHRQPVADSYTSASRPSHARVVSHDRDLTSNQATYGQSQSSSRHRPSQSVPYTSSAAPTNDYAPVRDRDSPRTNGATQAQPSTRDYFSQPSRAEPPQPSSTLPPPTAPGFGVWVQGVNAASTPKVPDSPEPLYIPPPNAVFVSNQSNSPAMRGEANGATPPMAPNSSRRTAQELAHEDSDSTPQHPESTLR